MQCITLQDLIAEYNPSVIKIDAEGAERYITSVEDFGVVRRLVVEWDWTHNRRLDTWEDVKRSLESHGFKLSIRGRMPDFDEGHAILTDARCKKRGNTGMIFVAARKPSSIDQRRPKIDSCPARSELSFESSASDAESGLQPQPLQPPQPPLASQLEALTTEQMEERLIQFGQSVRPTAPAEFFVMGFKERRRVELVQALCEAYEGQPRIWKHSVGVQLPPDAVARLLAVLERIKFAENARPSVNASGYLILRAAQAARFADAWGEERLLGELWNLAGQTLSEASQKAAAFNFTAMAVTKNFRGSPHVDQNDLSVQYALSAGNFEKGGELCIEENANLVRVLDTRNRIVCIDGRFPHWVSGYTGDRYSIIYYRTAGNFDPPVCAVHPV